MSAGPYTVKMFFRVMDNLTDEVLIPEGEEPETISVQPPPWCLDDMPVLDMQLELAAKLRKLYDLRKAVQNDDPAVAMLKDRVFTVRGYLHSYSGKINF